MRPIVAELYRVFGPYRLEDDFSGCSDCVSAQESTRLASIVRTDLTIADLNRYAFKAMTTWGSEQHFKYFLPRLLELAMEDFLAFNFPEVLLGKLKLAHWHEWPNVERQVITDFLTAFWLQNLNADGDFPHDEQILTVLGGLANANDSLKPYLDCWAEVQSEIAALHLAQLISQTADDILIGKKIMLWGNPEPHCTELIVWLSSEVPQQILGRRSERISNAFPYALQYLEGVRASVANR